jgi:hypothetical protein
VLDLDRSPVKGAWVVALQGGVEVASTVAGADGAYALAVPAGAYELRAGREGFTRRTRPVTVPADGAVNFGPTAEDLGNPYFLADDPEIERVEVLEGAPGQNLEVRVHLSEPLVEAARTPFTDAFRLYAGTETPFLRQVSTTQARRRLETRWDAAGRVFTARYAGPYLASGQAVAWYAVALAQDPLDEKDPDTREGRWEDLGLVDGSGRALGRGQMRYAFLKPELFPLGAEQLTDKLFGFYVQDRRWRLTHEGRFRFRAGRDAEGPGLVDASLRRDRDYGALAGDMLTLRFSEPMSAAKDEDNLFWTALRREQELVVLNVSDQASGPEFRPLAAALSVRELEIDRDDAREVRLYYPTGTFKDVKRVEVTLGKDVLDPAGNRPDPSRSRFVITVF